MVFDSLRQQVVLHFNRGTSDPDGDGHYDCIPAVDNFQIISADGGLTWGEVRNISHFLGKALPSQRTEDREVLLQETTEVCYPAPALEPTWRWRTGLCSLVTSSQRRGRAGPW